MASTFTQVRAYRSVEGWGMHFLASDEPVPDPNPALMLERMPAPAIADMMEWGPQRPPLAQLQLMAAREMLIERLHNAPPALPPVSDDRPNNEYWLLRGRAPRLWSWLQRVTPGAGVPPATTVPR